VKVRALEEGASGERWAELWSRLAELPDRAAAINLDRADVLAGALADLQRVKAGGG
jgi:DNA polymerase-3 subunit delta'